MDFSKLLSLGRVNMKPIGIANADSAYALDTEAALPNGVQEEFTLTVFGL